MSVEKGQSLQNYGIVESRWHRACLAFLLAMVAVMPADVVHSSDLPPAECLQLIRQARIAIELGKQEEGLALLHQAVLEHQDQFIPLVELLDYNRRLGLPEAEAKKLRQQLVTRLSDHDRPLPPGALRYLIDNPSVGEDELTLLLKAALPRLERAPDDKAMLYAVAMLQQRLQMPEAARGTLGRLYQLEPTSAVRWSLINMDLAKERWEQAAQLLEEVVGKPGHVSHRMLYVHVLAELGRYEELLPQIEMLQVGEGAIGKLVSKQIGELLLQVAWSLNDLGRHTEAEQMFRRVLRDDSENQEARRAILYLYSTDAERQAHEGELAASWAKEDDASRLLEEGANLLATGDARAAFPLLERAAAALPDSEVAWFNLGLAAFNLENWEAAEKALAEATRINPNRGAALLNRGAALQKLSRCEDAIPLLERALQLEPDLSQCHYYLYACHHALENDDKAREHLRLYQNPD